MDRWHFVKQSSKAINVRLWKHFCLGSQDLPELEIKSSKITKYVKDATRCLYMLSVPDLLSMLWPLRPKCIL